MKLSQIEKRILQTLTNSKDVMENEAWALCKKKPSWESWGDLSGDRYIICPKPPSPKNPAKP